ncbi:hypothetical protein RvY_00647-2 [Ramazzottius varieornatus]|uniref:Uncharacterized protein n=1 Tax=Ramazzottius varieornatus TaxID=947166 RepID=A0A1D1UJR7_RAMVA|nr:hypothetical protein RvY_00647-2 [Ramazzottius varieornatus]
MLLQPGQNIAFLRTRRRLPDHFEMYKSRTLAAPTSEVVKRPDSCSTHASSVNHVVVPNKPSPPATASILSSLSMSLRSFKIPLKRKDTTEAKLDETPTIPASPAKKNQPEVLEISTKPLPFVPKPSRSDSYRREYSFFDRRARQSFNLIVAACRSPVCQPNRYPGSGSRTDHAQHGRSPSQSKNCSGSR